MPKQDAIAERAAQMVEALRGSAAGQRYPLTVADLKAQAAPEASDEEVLKALTKKPHAEQVVVADKKDVNSPLALEADRDKLAASPLLLEYALGRVCTPEAPLQPVKKVVKQVDKALRDDFDEAITRQAAENALPEGVGQQTVKGKLHLYLERFPPPEPVKTPAMELSEKLVRALEGRQSRGAGAYPTTLSELLEEVDPAGTPLLRKAIGEEPFAGAALVAVPGKAGSPVALAGDRETLLNSPPLLEYALNETTSLKKPFATAEALAKGLAEDLRADFVEAVRRQAEAGTLPDKVAARKEEGEWQVYLEANLPPETILRDRLLGVLREHKAQGGDAYPLRWKDLAAEAAPESSPDEVDKIRSNKEFKRQVVMAVGGNPDSPVALAEDAEFLAASPLLLEFAVGQLSTAEKPLHPLDKVAKQLDKALRTAFEASVAERLASGQLPVTVAGETVKGKPHLRLARHQPPVDPAEALSNRLVERLRARREEDGSLPLRALLEEAAAPAEEGVVKQALGREPFRGSALVALPESEDSLVALADDAERLARDPRLLEAVLAAARTPDNQAVPVTDLTKKVAKDLQPTFTEALEQQVSGGSLPRSVGCLRIKRKPHLFLTADVSGPVRLAPPEKAKVAPAAPPKPEEAPPEAREGEAPAGGADFESLFDEAFERLDREEGSHNLVSLLDLREAVPVERPVFDRELQRLREEGRYSLSNAEGRHGISPEEQEAGIAEEGSLLLYVSRKAPAAV